jgi:hypothetical protein
LYSICNKWFFFRLTKTEDGLYYKVERGFLKEDDNISLQISSSPQTHIIDINPERDFKDNYMSIYYSFTGSYSELKKLLKEKFNSIIERKIKLADESTKII